MLILPLVALALSPKTKSCTYFVSPFPVESFSPLCCPRLEASCGSRPGLPGQGTSSASVHRYWPPGGVWVGPWLVPGFPVVGLVLSFKSKACTYFPLPSQRRHLAARSCRMEDVGNCFLQFSSMTFLLSYSKQTLWSSLGFLNSYESFWCMNKCWNCVCGKITGDSNQSKSCFTFSVCYIPFTIDIVSYVYPWFLFHLNSQLKRFFCLLIDALIFFLMGF